tara:strand:+ start:184 stop:297 length:114 start_codon:yes stop_codon:yes gene_type:complete
MSDTHFIIVKEKGVENSVSLSAVSSCPYILTPERTYF